MPVLRLHPPTYRTPPFSGAPWIRQVSNKIDALVTRTSQTKIVAHGDKTVELRTMWTPGRLIVRAQKNYAKFYGCRRLASRSAAQALVFVRLVAIERLSARGLAIEPNPAELAPGPAQ